MSRTLRAMMVLLLVSGCGGGGSDNFSAPRNLDDACSIVDERPNYLRAMQQTQRKWGVPVHVQMATIYQESKFIGNARTPLQYSLGVIPMGRQSSAYGYSQALDGTWDEYRQEQGRSRARRDSIDDATDFMGWYMNKTRDRNGIALTDARNQYLAYHEGHTGFARGSYYSKSWLLRVANEVESRALVYQLQLRSCGYS
ncbi:lytic transglycosylase [Pseudaestuariivita rosea]|uniref:transglycosylase SLT domain-containing protein n=1 Tax=Pseudaestuariivita rosea TaxID=2763263 RepID=UPI001ABAEFB8|nr:lytic transglycosylase [Pseudaestuariivita rosea]